MRCATAFVFDSQSFLSEKSIQNHSAHFPFQALLGSWYAGLTGNFLFCGRYADRPFERETYTGYFHLFS